MKTLLLGAVLAVMAWVSVDPSNANADWRHRGYRPYYGYGYTYGVFPYSANYYYAPAFPYTSIGWNPYYNFAYATYPGGAVISPGYGYRGIPGCYYGSYPYPYGDTNPYYYIP